MKRYGDLLPGTCFLYEGKLYATIRDCMNPNARPCILLETFVLLEIRWDEMVQVLPAKLVCVEKVEQ